MNITSLKNHKCLITAVFVLLVFHIWLASRIPYTHDDWEWGINQGMVHLLTADKDSRFCGNLIEVIITRNEFIKTVFMGIVFTLVPLSVTILSGYIFDIKKFSNTDLVRTSIFGFANAMLLSIPADVWSQTNSWIAGFSNFVVSGAELMFFLYILARSLSPKTEKKTWVISSILCFIYGVVIQLFLENLTIFYLIFAVVFLIVRWKKADKKKLIPLCAGLLAGTVLMFSSSIYPSLINTGTAVNEYRQLMYDPNQPFYVFIIDSIKRFFGVMLPQIIVHHGILTGSVSVIMAVATAKNAKNRLAALCLPLINSMLCIYYAATYIAALMTGRSVIEDSPLTTAIDSAFVLLIFIEIILVFKNHKKLLSWLLVLWLSPFMVIAPMLAVNTVGPRSYYTAYVCLIAFGATVLAFLLAGAKKKTAYMISAFIAAVLLGLCVRWIVIYKAIGDESRVRKLQIETAIANGDNYIYFEKFPYDDYLWFPDPTGPTRIGWYKDFYGIPEDIDIVFEIWKEQGEMPESI